MLVMKLSASTVGVRTLLRYEGTCPVTSWYNRQAVLVPLRPASIFPSLMEPKLIRSKVSLAVLPPKRTGFSRYWARISVVTSMLE